MFSGLELLSDKSCLLVVRTVAPVLGVPGVLLWQQILPSLSVQNIYRNLCGVTGPLRTRTSSAFYQRVKAAAAFCLLVSSGPTVRF